MAQKSVEEETSQRNNDNDDCGSASGSDMSVSGSEDGGMGTGESANIYVWYQWH